MRSTYLYTRQWSITALPTLLWSRNQEQLSNLTYTLNLTSLEIWHKCSSEAHFTTTIATGLAYCSLAKQADSNSYFSLTDIAHPCRDMSISPCFLTNSQMGLVTITHVINGKGLNDHYTFLLKRYLSIYLLGWLILLLLNCLLICENGHNIRLN